MKMRKHNDYSFLIKDKNFHGLPISDKFIIYLHNYYLQMLTEFFNEFGQTKAFKDEIKIKEEKGRRGRRRSVERKEMKKLETKLTHSLSN